MAKLMSYLPSIYHDIEEFVALTDTQDVELDGVKQATQAFFDNQFVMSANEQSVKRREQMLGIRADITTESLDFRRARLVNRYSTKPPFTIRYLQQRLDFLVGVGRTNASVDVQNFRLSVTAAIRDAAVFREVEHTIKTMIPANLVYQQETALNGKIGLKEQISARHLTRQARLSTTWKLGSTTFATEGPEVLIK